MRSVILLALLITSAQESIAQYFQFSQYNFTPTRVNPAWIGLTKYATIDFDYRNQKTGGNFNLNSNFFAIAYPLFNRSTGQPWSGIGLSIMDDKAGGIFKTQEASVSYALNLSTGKNQKLSFGFRGLMRTQRVDFDGLFTGSQYLEGHGFDTYLFNGENLGNLKTNFFTFSTGILWQQTDRRGNQLKQFDLAIFDANKPDNSFIGGDTFVQSTIIAHGSFQVFKHASLSLYPDFLFTRNFSKNVLNLGARWQYDLNPRSRNLTDKIDVITRYIIGRSAVAGIQIHREKISIGMSYDFPLIIKNYGNLGALEIALAYKTPVDPRSRKIAYARKKQEKRKKAMAKKVVPKNRQQKPIPTNARKVQEKTKPTVAENLILKTPKEKTILVKTDTATSTKPQITAQIKETQPEYIIEKKDTAYIDTYAQAGKISQEPLLIEKVTLHFQFDYNSTDLDDETEKYLNELSITLKENKNLNVKVTGHTDNIGSVKMNQHLSLKRAEEIKKYLLKQGIETTRIITEGKGMAEPLNNNETDSDRSKNRRVEIDLLSQPAQGKQD